MPAAGTKCWRGLFEAGPQDAGLKARRYNGKKTQEPPFAKGTQRGAARKGCEIADMGRSPCHGLGGGNCGAKATAGPSHPKVKMDDETIAHRVFGMRA
jgi:hypothetical protein